MALIVGLDLWLGSLALIVGSDCWLGLLAWIAGFDCWLWSLVWIVGLDRCFGLLFWIVSLDRWLGSLAWIINLDRWLGSLDGTRCRFTESCLYHQQVCAGLWATNQKRPPIRFEFAKCSMMWELPGSRCGARADRCPAYFPGYPASTTAQKISFGPH